MKRLSTLAAALLLTAACFGQTRLTTEEWRSIPPTVQDKIRRILNDDAQQIAALSRELQNTGAKYKFMVEDGQTWTLVPENSVFTQLPRERTTPPEGNYVYNRWSDMTDISAAYISPDMFRMMKELPRINILGRQLNLSGIVSDLSGLYQLDFARYRKSNPEISYCRNSTSGGLRRDIRTFLEQGNYKTWMELRQNGMYTRLYLATRGNVVTGFVLVNLDDSFDYGRFVCFEGKIPRDKFEALLTKTLK